MRNRIPVHRIQSPGLAGPGANKAILVFSDITWCPHVFNALPVCPACPSRVPCPRRVAPGVPNGRPSQLSPIDLPLTALAMAQHVSPVVTGGDVTSCIQTDQNLRRPRHIRDGACPGYPRNLRQPTRRHEADVASHRPARSPGNNPARTHFAAKCSYTQNVSAALGALLLHSRLFPEKSGRRTVWHEDTASAKPLGFERPHVRPDAGCAHSLASTDDPVRQQLVFSDLRLKFHHSAPGV
jgi:hypothetical protein